MGFLDFPSLLRVKIKELVSKGALVILGCALRRLILVLMLVRLSIAVLFLAAVLI